MRLSNGTKRRDKVANRENYTKHNHILLDLVQRVLDFNCIRLYLSSRVLSKWLPLYSSNLWRILLDLGIDQREIISSRLKLYIYGRTTKY